MTRDAVTVVRQVFDAFGRRDIDGVLNASAHDLEVDFTNSRGPLSGVYRGHAEAREFFISFLEPWATVSIDTRELAELKDGRVLSVATIETRGEGSGAQVDATGAMIWTVRDGEVAAVKMYQSKDEAFDAGTS